MKHFKEQKKIQLTYYQMVVYRIIAYKRYIKNTPIQWY